MTGALSWVPEAHVDICASRGFNVIQVPHLAIGLMGCFEVFTSGFAWACFARWVSTLISVNEPLMAINAACLRTLSPQGVLKHALGRKCSLMATPSKRDSVNAQLNFEIRSVD